MHLPLLFVLLSLLLTGCFHEESTETTDSDISPQAQYKTVDVTIWSGATESEIHFPDEALGMSLYQASDRECDLENYSVCPGGKLRTIESPVITETNDGFANSDWYWLQDEKSQISEAKMTTPVFGPRRIDGNIVEFKNKLWVIGGGERDGSSDVWSSEDGINWKLETVSANFPYRRSHQLFVFNDRVWLMGGAKYGAGYPRMDVWSSADGIQWQLEKENLAFLEKDYYDEKDYLDENKIIVFQNKIWYFASYPYVAEGKNEVWVSENGVKWEKVTPEGSGVPNFEEIVVFQNKFVIRVLDKILSSSDAINWKLEAEDIPFAWGDSRMTIFNDKVYVYGKYAGNEDNTILYWSGDLVNWEKQQTTYPAKNYNVSRIVNFKNNLLLFKSRSDRAVYRSNDAVNWSVVEQSNPSISDAFGGDDIAWHNGKFWRSRWHIVESSKNGIDWQLETYDKDLPEGAKHLVSFNGKLWNIHHEYVLGSGFINYVSSSSNGVEWTLDATLPGFYLTYSSLVYFKEKWWLYTINGEIWSSPDLVNWAMFSDSAAFPNSVNQEFSSFDGKLWMVNAVFESWEDEVGTLHWHWYSDIWSSEDGVNWNKVVDDPVFGYQNASALINFNGKLWLIGGFSLLTGAPLETLNIWSSENGIDWQQEETDIQLFEMSYLGVQTDEDIYLFQKTKYLGMYEIGPLKSSNGTNWKLGHKKQFRIPLNEE